MKHSLSAHTVLQNILDQDVFNSLVALLPNDDTLPLGNIKERPSEEAKAIANLQKQREALIEELKKILATVEKKSDNSTDKISQPDTKQDQKLLTENRPTIILKSKKLLAMLRVMKMYELSVNSTSDQKGCEYSNTYAAMNQSLADLDVFKGAIRSRTKNAIEALTSMPLEMNLSVRKNEITDLLKKYESEHEFNSKFFQKTFNSKTVKKAAIDKLLQLINKKEIALSLTSNNTEEKNTTFSEDEKLALQQGRLGKIYDKLPKSVRDIVLNNSQNTQVQSSGTPNTANQPSTSAAAL